jgi:hypothetical protein
MAEYQISVTVVTPNAVTNEEVADAMMLMIDRLTYDLNCVVIGGLANA